MLHPAPSDRNKKVTLFCFSPEVMLATFILELLMAIYVRFKYGLSRVSVLIMLTLLCLAIFQGVEYQICTLGGTSGWTKIGLVAITLLPPLGIHIVAALTGHKRFVPMAYLLGLAYIGVFVFLSGVVNGATCGGNYVILDMMPTTLYGAYYTALLFVGIIEAWSSLKNPKMNHKNKEALGWLIVGYGSFMIPMGVVYLLVPAARNGTPSIMCGFAIILAFILAFQVMALADEGQKLVANTKK